MRIYIIIYTIAKDVKHYLISRYGLEMCTKDIQKMVFQDLAGGSKDTDCIDICELVAILLIPFFAKVRTKSLFFFLLSKVISFGFLVVGC